MKSKHNLLTMLMLALASTLLIFTTCEKDDNDNPNNSEPAANFETDKKNIALGESVTFTAQSTKNPTSWSWDFGDGNTSTEENPSHTYNNIGAYTVELTVSNNFGSDTETKADYITVTSPINWGDGVTDIDGNNYVSVIIGNQEWMAENLKTTTYNEGSLIDLVTNSSTWSSLTTGAYCWYDHDPAQYAETYGALYNWHTVNTGNLCPDDWHVPSDEEWKILEMELGMSQSEADEAGYRGTSEGSKLAGNAALWNDGVLKNGSGFGSSGFMALPGGDRYHVGAFYLIGINTGWWSATEQSTDSVWCRYLHHHSSDVRRSKYYKGNGFSVRCLRD